jgi:hypothetical protein
MKKGTGSRSGEKGGIRGKGGGGRVRRRLKDAKEAGGGERGQEKNEAEFEEKCKRGSMPKWEKVVEVGKGMEGKRRQKRGGGRGGIRERGRRNRWKRRQEWREEEAGRLERRWKVKETAEKRSRTKRKRRDGNGMRQE